MRLEQIAYFLQVAERGSISGAARELYISQPALSKQITLLEKEVGVPLFERQSRGVVLTNAGIQFEKDLKNILQSLEQAKKNAALAGRTRKKLLNVGCFDGAYTDDFLPQFFDYCHRTIPDYKMVFRRLAFSDGEKVLRKNGIDLWITLEHECDFSDQYLVKEIIRRNGAIIYPADSEPGRREQVEPADFYGATFVTVQKEKSPGIYHNAIRKMRDMGIVPGEIEETDDIFTTLNFVKLMNGFTILSEDVVHVVPGLKSLVLPKNLGVGVIAVWNRYRSDITEWMEAYQNGN